MFLKRRYKQNIKLNDVLMCVTTHAYVLVSIHIHTLIKFNILKKLTFKLLLLSQANDHNAQL